MNRTLENHVPPEAATLYRWLAVSDPVVPVDFAIGFGHFDLRIPAVCVDLVRTGHARRIVFTGGVGAGSADLPAPEAVVFAEEARRLAPGLSAEDVLVESSSTNTGDNLRFTCQLAARQGPHWAIDRPGVRLILVATPYRQRRVERTTRALLSHAVLFNHPPRSNIETDFALFASKSQDLLPLLVGELQRLRDYPARGWCAPCPIPPEIEDAGRRLDARLRR